jgi:hypothetical protein
MISNEEEIMAKIGAEIETGIGSTDEKTECNQERLEAYL